MDGSPRSIGALFILIICFFRQKNVVALDIFVKNSIIILTSFIEIFFTFFFKKRETALK
jgi:hypothetical protein